MYHYFCIFLGNLHPKRARRVMVPVFLFVASVAGAQFIRTTTCANAQMSSLNPGTEKTQWWRPSSSDYSILTNLRLCINRSFSIRLSKTNHRICASWCFGDISRCTRKVRSPRFLPLLFLISRFRVHHASTWASNFNDTLNNILISMPPVFQEKRIIKTTFTAIFNNQKLWGPIAGLQGLHRIEGAPASSCWKCDEFGIKLTESEALTPTSYRIP